MSQNDTHFLEQTIRGFDQAIKEGRTEEVLFQISRISHTKLSRNHRLELATLCRRVGMNAKGLKFLTPIIHPKNPLSRSATEKELAEYAVLLSRIGGLEESQEILHSIDKKIYPQASMFYAFSLISSWNYSEALSHLRIYIEEELNPYQNLIAKVNLVACLVELENFEEGLEVCLQAQEQSCKLKAQRLLGNLFELQAQIFIGLKEFEKAISSLEQAHKQFQSAKGYDLLFVKKWQAYVECQKTQSVLPLNKIYEESYINQHWETLRDLDFLSLKIQFDNKKMNHLIAGSPAKSFKRKVQAALMSQASKSYCWGTQDGPRLSMLTGCFNGKMLFELGSTQHRLFQALSMDLYSPRSSGTLFSRTYPGESFNIFSSPAKLRQQIFRLRQKLKSHNIPIIIENNKDLYWLNLVGPITVELETFPQPLVRTELLLKKLASNSNPYLSAQEVCEILGFSRSHFLRLKMGWQNQGNMETKGIGKATRYRFIAS